MGGGHFDGDVAERSRSTSEENFVHTAAMRELPVEKRDCHPTLVPYKKIRECCETEEHPDVTPIAVLMDVTRSRGKDAKDVSDKLPMLIGQIIINNYLVGSHPEICFSGVGDATYDKASLQVAQFESDNRLDVHLGNLWLEEGGGGTGQESYQNAAYYFARKTKLDCLKRGKKGKAFIFADEGFYPVVSKSEIKRIIGDNLDADIPSAQIFRELQEKYDTYVIFPRQTYEERKKDIDEEIWQRVTQAGGMMDGVDVRFSLIWHNRNDLDLHVKTPSGDEIFYNNKIVGDGELDVDRNVRGETTKPVENTRWPKGKAPKGTYEVWVENYRFHEQSREATPFKVEIEVNGEIQHFEGETPAQETHTASRVTVGKFRFDRAERQQQGQSDHYAGYNDATIRAQWTSVVPSEHILMIDNAKACVDIILGVLALTSGARTLEQYLHDMEQRGQSENRIAEVKASLAGLAELTGASRVKIPRTRTTRAQGGKKSRSVRI